MEKFLKRGSVKRRKAISLVSLILVGAFLASQLSACTPSPLVGKGGDIPVFELGDSKEANLNEAISQWLQFGPKGREQFYDWLRDKGYFKKPYVGIDGKKYWR